MARSHRPFSLVAACGLLVPLLAGCGGATHEAPPPAATSQSVVVVADGVSVTLTVPAGWDRAGQEVPLVVRAQKPYGDPGFTANVVVTTEAPGGSTLVERTAAAADFLAGTADWTVDPTQPGPIELAGLPAHRFGGTRTVDGIEVSQVETIVEVATTAGTAFAFVTESFATQDADGAAQARAVTDSLVVTPVG
ncbi:hypothetical protein EQW78_02640 [Oerskovia turbata]|uniref:Lipoprotein LpqN n=1 Tax=Oerskovia turbata TaxID=1713 RepID=A0A4Q1L0C8_9CELL|nr:hypothetical protein [Oerskovia turbata]RXR26968.1 hypothetical protein EQW73_05780 [Oerskovia turbata]RXR36189.1 hypothetical protein EQW78_02640 [Oerskovia turbata]TGJ95378.1 hypothetical protein DLJ96_12415 [Actinotalea fermentans ATCC 43279 = JCM 9966 = DSM 3133]